MVSSTTPRVSSGGFVYALYSESMNRHAPDAGSIIHKVGYTTRDISIRIKEFERGMVPGIVIPLLLVWVSRDVRSCESHVLDRLKEYNVKGDGGARENFECSLAVIYDAFNSYPHIEWRINHLIGKGGPDRPVVYAGRRDGDATTPRVLSVPVDVPRGHDAVGSVALYLGATTGVYMSTTQFEINLRDVLAKDEYFRTQGGRKMIARGRSETYIRKTVGSSDPSKTPRGILGLFGPVGIRLSPDCVLRVTSVRELWDTLENLHATARKYKKLDKSKGWLILHSLKYLIKKRASAATAV